MIENAENKVNEHVSEKVPDASIEVADEGTISIQDDQPEDSIDREFMK